MPVRRAGRFAQSSARGVHDLGVFPLRDPCAQTRRIVPHTGADSHRRQPRDRRAGDRAPRSNGRVVRPAGGPVAVEQGRAAVRLGREDRPVGTPDPRHARRRIHPHGPRSQP